MYNRLFLSLFAVNILSYIPVVMAMEQPSTEFRNTG